MVVNAKPPENAHSPHSNSRHPRNTVPSLRATVPKSNAREVSLAIQVSRSLRRQRFPVVAGDDRKAYVERKVVFVQGSWIRSRKPGGGAEAPIRVEETLPAGWKYFVDACSEVPVPAKDEQLCEGICKGGFTNSRATVTTSATSAP